MAATSLAEQLQKLTVPQSTIYKEDKKKASLLFDPKEAAAKDRNTFYEIGISGLKELIALYEGFHFYEDSLFSLSSKDFERAVQSKEVNQNLDQAIEKFLLQISPYLLLQSAHKALEWLVNRYSIHEYNQDAVLALILPYHETKIFVRFVQLLNIKSNSNRWHWLRHIQKTGFPLGKQILYNQCVSNPATLSFIGATTLKYVNEFGDRASQLNTIFAFFCSTAIGTIKSSKRVTEAIMNALLPTILKALESPIIDFRSSAYVTLGYLSSKASIKVDTLNDIVVKLLTEEFTLSYDVALLINLIYTNQVHVNKISDGILYNMSVDTVNILCRHMKKMVEQKINIQRFVMVFLSSILPVLQSDSEEFRRFSQLPEILLDEVDLKSQQPEKVIKCVFDSLQSNKGNSSLDGDESDIEIIDDDDDDDDDFSNKVLCWYSSLLKSIENKYPDSFDKVIKEEFSSKNKGSNRRHAKVSKVLGFKPAVARKIGGSYLFENLNHVNPDKRIEAVKYVAKDFEKLKAENIDFVRQCFIDRANDDNVEVVSAVLEIKTDYLKEVLSETELTDCFVNILSRNPKKWLTVIRSTISKFCLVNILPVNQNTVLALVPHLFPNDQDSADIAWQILNSCWGEKLGFINNLNFNESVKKSHKNMCKIVFKKFFDDRAISFDKIVDINKINKNNTTDVLFYMLLKSCTFNKTTTEELIDILNLLLEVVENRSIVRSTEKTSFCSQIMPQFLNQCRKDKIMFESLEYIFDRMIESIKCIDISKPWCNVYENSDIVLIRRLFEIFLTGCCIQSYEGNYSALLEKLLNSFLNNSQEKFEFIANIACGHILYATDPKDVISPELQLRSLKLLNNFIAVQDNTWVYDSDILITMILFDLKNPMLTIRQCIIDLINNLLRQVCDKKMIYVQLLTELVSHKEELLLDHEQIPQVLNTILCQQSLETKFFRRNCLLRLTSILRAAPPHISSELINILPIVNNSNVFSSVISSLSNSEKKFKENNSKLVFDIYESKLFKNVYSCINETTVSSFNIEHVWESIVLGLKEYRECIVNEDQSLTSPAVLILKQIDEVVFKKIPDDKVKDFVLFITLSGTFSNNSKISSMASKVMKKIHLKFSDFKPIFDGMLTVQDPAVNVPKKKKFSVSMLSYQLIETKEWRLGVTMLEYVQSKKKMSIDNTFVSVLFQMLNRCLRFEEQSYVEYTKQLILSSLWYYCKKFVDDNNKDQLKSLRSMFDIELVVQCIRGTQNPQTHHHALILLSHAAYMMPEQVLHHTMEIFTFMGSSVLRHDDAYSFQVITKIIETLIPILVKLDKTVEDHTDIELQKLQNRVVPILRIFADVVLHVPEHRRLPLYKKLIETLGPNQFLWVFLALVLETHVAHFNENKEKEKQPSRTLADQESPVDRLDFAQSLSLEFSSEIILENFIKLIIYLKSLPQQKEENQMETDVNPSDIFSVNGHTHLQLRHYKYAIITFMNTCLASSRFIQHSSQATDIKTLESHYKTFIINILTFIQSISKLSDEKTAKYWRVMLHHSYDLLDHTNNLLSAPMFVSVIRGLLKHTLPTVRRKSMELLNSKIQFSPEMFNGVDKDLMHSIIPALLDIVKTIENKEKLNETAAQELELNQQTALLSLKLLTRMQATTDPEPFKPVLETVTEYTCNSSISGNVMASIVLCLAELCANLKAHALASLRKFMPALIKVLKKQRKAKTPELVLLSTVTAISKIVESLPLFLSPYLQKILYEYSILFAKWQKEDQECSKVSGIVTKLSNIRKKIASSIPPRVLIPIINETHNLLLEKEYFDAVGPAMSVLADSFLNVTTADFTALQQDLTGFFLSALQLRSNAAEKNIDAIIIERAEDEVINALVSLVLKLSETSFRPFYFKIYDWAIRTNIEGHKDRTITFYRLSCAIAEKLKGLFVLFAGHFIKNAAELLDSSNVTKSEDLYFDCEEKCVTLIHNVIKTLHIVFLYDSQNFINKDRFETLMQPIVDQLENTLGGISALKSRATEHVIPCISQFAVATADDSLWKLLNYQVLLKTRHNDADIRLLALDCLVAMATQLGSSWLPLLAESVPFLAELLEDGDPRIESSTKDAIRKLEQILDEPLEKYF